jgi:hypothetical protein
MSLAGYSGGLDTAGTQSVDRSPPARLIVKGYRAVHTAPGAAAVGDATDTDTAEAEVGEAGVEVGVTAESGVDTAVGDAIAEAEAEEAEAAMSRSTSAVMTSCHGFIHAVDGSASHSVSGMNLHSAISPACGTGFC